MNGDGKMDMVLATKTKIMVLLGNGNGTFGSPITYSLPVQTSSAPKPDTQRLEQRGGVDIVLADALSNLDASSEKPVGKDR